MLGAAEEFEMLPGRGVCARIDGKCILEGKAALLLEHGVEMTMPGEAGDYIDRGCTATYVAAEGEFIGFLALSDTLHEESAATIKLNMTLSMTLSMTLNFVAITLAIIGTLNPVVGAGIYYLSKEKHDPESKKIYTVVSVIGGAVAIVCAVLLAVV